MKVLVLGSGGREHAIAAALARSPRVEEVLVAPGNDGMLDVARRLDVPLDDLDRVAEAARAAKIRLTIAGSEEPLVRGAWNVFDRKRMRLFGPSAEAAQLEGSKVWAKEFMRRHAIPTASFSIHDDFDAARSDVARRPLPFVIKADGLAAGKGVHVIQERDAAERALRGMMLEGAYGSAGRRVVIEEALTGVELSVFAISDGYSHRILGCAQDHKRAYDGDRGPNTGGMGAYSPPPLLEPSVLREIEARILTPTLAGMLDEGAPYRGFLYLGLMLTASGPQLLEYNCRLGDPEAQVLLPRIGTDFCELIEGADEGDVISAPLQLVADAAVGVVVASEGYPGKPAKGRPVRGIEAARERGAEVFCAGVARADTGLVTAGGRILSVVGKAATVPGARSRAYEALDAIAIPGAFHRTDIAQRAMARELWQSRASAS
jgi:phosphoribosylamine--glycine ligase